MKDRKQFLLDAQEMHVEYIVADDASLTYDEAQAIAWEQGIAGLVKIIEADINVKSEIASRLRSLT
jgi:hypothetical protein